MSWWAWLLIGIAIGILSVLAFQRFVAWFEDHTFSHNHYD